MHCDFAKSRTGQHLRQVWEVLKPSNIQLLLLETQISRSSSMDNILLPPLVFQKEKISSWFLSFGTKVFEVSCGVAGREAGLVTKTN